MRIGCAIYRQNILKKGLILKTGLLRRISWSAIANWLGLVILFIASFAVRMIDLKDPPLDFHPVRQLHSAIIARGAYLQPGYDSGPGFTPNRDVFCRYRNL